MSACSTSTNIFTFSLSILSSHLQISEVTKARYFIEKKRLLECSFSFSSSFSIIRKSDKGKNKYEKIRKRWKNKKNRRRKRKRKCLILRLLSQKYVGRSSQRNIFWYLHALCTRWIPSKIGISSSLWETISLFQIVPVYATFSRKTISYFFPSFVSKKADQNRRRFY